MMSMSAMVSPARDRAFQVDSTGPMPMISGAQPLMAKPIGEGLQALLAAYSSLQTSVAEAPSVSGDDVPAVTVPVSEKASFKAARP